MTRLVSLLVWCSLLFLGCDAGSGRVIEGVSDTPHRLRALTVRADEGEWLERVPGTVRPSMEATIEAKVNGRIAKIYVREGSGVAEGAPLVDLSADELSARLDQALALERQARQNLARFSKLLPQGAVTPQEYDAVETQMKLAVASVEEARTMVGYTKIVSPFAGVVTQKFSDEGDIASPGKPLLKVERRDLFRFEMDVPESSARSLLEGGPIQVQISGVDAKVEGTISELSPTTDPNSRTRLVKVDLSGGHPFSSGQFGYGMIAQRGRPAVRVPEAALIIRGQMEAVFIHKDGRAEMRLVRTGKRGDDGIEILSGLDDGEVVLLGELAMVRDGEKVELVQ